MPGSGDPASELLRGLAILADRDTQRAYIASIVTRAGLSMTPAAAWLVLRLGEQPGTKPGAIAREHHIPEVRIEEALLELGELRYVEPLVTSSVPVKLTEAGCAAFDRLAAARRERLRELYAEWPESQRQQLAMTLQRLAKDLVPPRAA